MVANVKEPAAAASTGQRSDSADRWSNVTSIEEHKATRRRAMAQQMRHECAMVDDATNGSVTDDAADQDFDESGRRESNPRSQLGKKPSGKSGTRHDWLKGLVDPRIRCA
jgi:hypothetical protein